MWNGKADDRIPLSKAELRALRIFLPYTDFEPLSKHVRIGLGCMQSLVQRGLAEEGHAGVYGRSFKLTADGRQAVAFLASERRLHSRRQPVEWITVDRTLHGRLELTFIGGSGRTRCVLEEAQARHLVATIAPPNEKAP